MRAHQHMVYTTAARLSGNDRQAEDIAQEAFLKAYENFAQLRTQPFCRAAGSNGHTESVPQPHLALPPPLAAVLGDASADSEEDEPEVEFALPDDVLAGVDADVRHELIEEALQRLPERQRLPLVLYHFEELSYEEIAEKLGISLAKVKIDIFRARAALAKVLAQRGVTAATSLGAP